MNWWEINIHTTAEAQEAVGEILRSLGAAGTVVSDRDPGQLSTVRAEPQNLVVSAYYPQVDQSPRPDSLVKTVQERLRKLPQYGLAVGPGRVTWREVAERDWETAWQAFWHPTRVGPGMVIVPSWEEYQPQAGDLVIKLDPGMAFGTGTHPTTRMCLEILQTYCRTGDRVLDLGTGSGILAVAAALLGAREVLAVDVDPVAVRVAEQNVVRNRVTGVLARQGDLNDDFPWPADLVLANITAEVLAGFSPRLRGLLTAAGLAVLGGIIAERVGLVQEALAGTGLIVKERYQEGEWVTLVVGA